MNKILRKMKEMRSGNVNPTVFDNEDFYDSFVSYIKENSKLLSRAIIMETEGIMTNSFLSIADSSNIITLLGNDALKPPTNIGKLITATPKVLGIETKIQSSLYSESISDEEEKRNIEKILLKPFLKSIEKQFISGNYFDKSIFKTTNTISGTNDFDGLLKLVRELKDKTDNGCIIGNSSVISGIVDTIDKDPYLTEYLLNKTIEGIPIIETIDAPANYNGKILAGFDLENIVLLLVNRLDMRKFSVVQDLNKYFQVFCYANGGDFFNTAVALEI